MQKKYENKIKENNLKLEEYKKEKYKNFKILNHPYLKKPCFILGSMHNEQIKNSRILKQFRNENIINNIEN